MSYHNEDGGFLKGAVIGGLLGCLAGILLAPKAGKDLRQDLAEGYSTLSERAQDLKDRGERLFPRSQRGAQFLLS